MANAVASRHHRAESYRQIITKSRPVCVRGGSRASNAGRPSSPARYHHLRQDGRRERDRRQGRAEMDHGELGCPGPRSRRPGGGRVQEERPHRRTGCRRSRGVAEKHRTPTCTIASVRLRTVPRAPFSTSPEWIEVGPWTADAGGCHPARARHDRQCRQMACGHAQEDGRAGEDSWPASGTNTAVGKNLRYAIEFFTSVLCLHGQAPREGSASCLKDLQDHLGALDDIAAREALVASGDGPAKPRHCSAAKDSDILISDRAQSAHSGFAGVKYTLGLAG